MSGTVPPIPPPLGTSYGNPSSLNVNRVDTMPTTTNPINTTTTTNASQSVIDENLPQLLDSTGGSHVTNVPAFDKEDFTSWKVRFLVFIDGLEPYILKTLEDGPFVPMSSLSTSENPLPKRQNQWSNAEIRLANQDKRLKSIIISFFLNDVMKSVIKCKTAKEMWNDLILAHEGPSDIRDTKIAALRLKFNAFKSLEELCLQIRKRFYKRSGRVRSARKPIDKSKETCFACGKTGYFQKDCPSNKTSTPSHSSLNNPSNKPKPHTPPFNQTSSQNTGNHQKDYKGKCMGLKAKMAVLTKRIDDLTKGKSEKEKNEKGKSENGLIAESFDWDGEYVSSEDEGTTKIRTFIAIAEEESSIRKADARSGQWVYISMKKVHRLLSMTDGNERKHVLDYTHIDLYYVEDQRMISLALKGSLKNRLVVKSPLTNCSLIKYLATLSRPWEEEEPLPPLPKPIGATPAGYAVLDLEHAWFLVKSRRRYAVSSLLDTAIEGDAINFNENRSFPDNEFLKPRSKVTHCSANIEYFPYIPSYENTTPTDSPILQDFEFTNADNHTAFSEHDHFKSAESILRTLVPQDRWSREKHIELVNIIGKPLTALEEEGWIIAMQEELNQFERNKVWTLVPKPHGKTIIRTKWIWKNKMDENGVVIKNKARLVTQAYNQQKGIYYEETFAPVARLEAIKIFLAYASYMGFMIYQMDVKSVFLNGKILKEVYVQQPLGFESTEFPSHVCKLDKALYGLKYQANPKESHFVVVKRIFRYLKGNPNIGLWYLKGSGFDLKTHSDSDYVGCNLNRKSTSWDCQILGGKLVCWSAKKQSSVAMSSAKAEKKNREANICYIRVLSMMFEKLLGENYINGSLTFVKPHIISAASFQKPLASEVRLTLHMLKVAKFSQKPEPPLILSSEKVNVDDTADKSSSRTFLQLPSHLDDDAQITFLGAEPCNQKKSTDGDFDSGLRSMHDDDQVSLIGFETLDSTDDDSKEGAEPCNQTKSTYGDFDSGLRSMPNDDQVSLIGFETLDSTDDDSKEGTGETSYASADMPAQSDPLGHLYEELRILNNKFDQLESSITKKVTDDIQPINREFNAFNTLKSRRFVTLQQELSKVIKTKLGLSDKNKVRKGMKVVSNKLALVQSTVATNSQHVQDLRRVETMANAQGEQPPAQELMNVEQAPPVNEESDMVLDASVEKSSEENTSKKIVSDDEPPVKKLKFLIPTPSIPPPTPLNSIMPEPTQKEPTPLRDESKRKGIATEEPLKDIMPFMKERGSVPKILSFKLFFILEGQLTNEDVMAQVKDMKRLADLKAKKEKSEKSL
uniref:Retrovirus-related Pol polyprotein from transposon TNT 1-94 n=1 Tax=Tanacetum cinerariifolium TaxID=118510 RepID=A0A6L2LJU8_TANCI|nr:retrovirus-related Pol polyprotein from transposon TNT 1-94 [Tanacetum cinerariifolium]